MSGALADRYGLDRPRARRAVLAASTAVALVFLAWLGWSTWVHATPEVTSQLVSFAVVDEHRALARVDVRTSGPEVVGSCTVQALAEDHSVVGQLTFSVSGREAARGARIERELRTERRATALDLLGCTTADQSRPR